MPASLMMKQVLLAAYIVVCSCLQPLQQIENVDLLRQKRSLWGGAKPTGKTCLNFCNAVAKICGHGSCELNANTCAIKCNCEPGYTGHWCSEVDDQYKDTSSQSSNVGNQGSDVTTSPPVLNSVPITSGSPKITDESVPFINQTTELNTGLDIRNKTEQIKTLNFTSAMENNTEESVNNVSISVGRTTESILQNSNVYDSLADCKTKCIFGQCLNLNGIIRCFPIAKKDSDNKTTKQDASNCPPGFPCDHGKCELQKNNHIHCRCERNWIGDLCHKHCPSDCGENGRCIIVDHTTNQLGCLCDEKYTGSRCQELAPTPIEEEEVRHWYVIGVCVAILFVLLLLIIILPYWMWRRRWLFIMKVVHYFQHYEEDDGKEYDAFISYKSSKDDEKFVLEQLYPKLEKEMGFKLCMHFRDFMPGDAIANNIIRAIENSRRTIMVLSPNYIDSEWCRMEYQKAQHEMLKLKHKIIPVVLEDISKSKFIDKNLKTILNTVTYLEWPGVDQSKKLERFWKHLELSMPKKHSSVSPEPLQSVTVSSSPSQVHLLSCSTVPLSSPITDSEIINSSDERLPDISTNNNKTNDASKGRLQRMMKEFRKLRITIDNNKTPISRENSLESCPSTPITATPSPGVFLMRDNSPLIKAKTPRNGRNKQTKSSTWSPRSHKDATAQGLTQHSSLREADRRSNSNIDVVPQIQCFVNNQCKNLPDICRTSDGGYLNVVCEVETPPPSPEDNVTNIKSDMKVRTNCPTCVLKCDVDNNELEFLRTASWASTDENDAIQGETRKCKIIGMNIPPSNNNTKILNIDDTLVCVFCNDKNCDCCNSLNADNGDVENRNILNATTVSVESNYSVIPPIAPARRKKNKKNITHALDDNGNKLN